MTQNKELREEFDQIFGDKDSMDWIIDTVRNKVWNYLTSHYNKILSEILEEVGEDDEIKTTYFTLDFYSFRL